MTLKPEEKRLIFRAAKEAKYVVLWTYRMLNDMNNGRQLYEQRTIEKYLESIGKKCPERSEILYKRVAGLDKKCRGNLDEIVRIMRAEFEGLCVITYDMVGDYRKKIPKDKRYRAARKFAMGKRGGQPIKKICRTNRKLKKGCVKNYSYSMPADAI